jgi:hypothetical protein
MTEAITTPTKTNKAALIRELLKDKTKSPTQIAVEVGCNVQYVYGVMAYERSRQKKLRAKRKVELLKGAAKRKYTKSGKYAKKSVTVVASPTLGEIKYVQVDVPQPHYNLTWKQRFVAFFFGRV